MNRTGESIPGTKVPVLQAVDDMFVRRGIAHTIAVMACGLEKRQDLIDFIRSRKMVVQLHCWTHEDMTVDDFAHSDLARAVDHIDLLLGQRPTVLYPPWNRSSPVLEEAADKAGLVVSWQKVSLSQWLRARGGVAENVINFHHWHVPDVILLGPALRVPRR